MSASWPDARQRVARNHHFLVGREHPYRYGTVGSADSRPTPEIGGLKEPRGDVRRVADRGVIHPEVGADTADDNEPSEQQLLSFLLHSVFTSAEMASVSLAERHDLHQQAPPVQRRQLIGARG